MGDTFVVVGGDAAGMSAASKAKRDDPDLDVVAFERGEWVSYAACGLPYYVKGEVASLEDLVSVTPEAFREERDVDLRTGHEVVDIDPEGRTVTAEADGEVVEQPYDHLLVATGARAVEPPFGGMDLDGVFTFHDMADGRVVREFLRVEEGAIAATVGEGYGDGREVRQFDRMSRPESVAVVGGGYVGIELAEALRAHDLTVHLFEMLPHVLEPFGEAVAGPVEAELREQGVQLHLDMAVDGFRGDDTLEAVAVEGGDEIPVEMALVGVGVVPNVDLAADAGVELGPTGAIATDDFGRTNLPDVYAAGDCAEAHNLVTGEPDHVPLALTANRAGRAIGRTVAGEPTPTGGILGTAAVKAFDLEVARTGLTDEAAARDAGFDPVSVTIQAPSRAHYYPGAAELTIFLMADRGSGRLLGASAVGADDVPKRIDTVAAALHEGATVDDLAYYDLTYAPPFSPVWDPVLTAAKVLGGKVEG